MKPVLKLLRRLLCCLGFAVSAAFAGIEAFALVTGDWLLFEIRVWALVQLLVRILIALGALRVSLRALVRPERSYLWEGIGFLAAAAASAAFSATAWVCPAWPCAFCSC